MKKFLLPLLSIVLFTACQKEITTTKAQEEIAGPTANKPTKFFVCHYDAVTTTSKTIEVTQNALAAHLAHGDVQGECSTIQTTNICSQIWMVKNLEVTTYRNGEVIPEVTNQAEWESLTTGAWCYYNNDPANGPIYGKLYNWYAINDPRGLAPIGWHIPTYDDWRTLDNCFTDDGATDNGGQMKSTGTIEFGTGLWYYPNTDATNGRGFTALPGGVRVVGGFILLGLSGYFWSSTVDQFNNTFYSVLNFNSGGYFLTSDNLVNSWGMSVRCLKD